MPRRASIAFALKNVPGVLFKALSVFALRDISLSKIESRPMRGRPWEYVFFADILRGDDEAARNALRHLGEIAEFVKVLGVYPGGEVAVAEAGKRSASPLRVFSSGFGKQVVNNCDVRGCRAHPALSTILALEKC